MKNKKYAVAVLAAATTAAFLLFNSHVQSQPHPSPQMKLGGSFIGSGGGIIWNAFQIPLDSAGRTAAVRVYGFTYGPDTAGLLASFDADTLGELTGQVEMISRDTAKGRWVSYGTKQGNPPLIRAIIVWTGTVKFTGPDSLLVNLTVDVYAAAADADGDGLPDSGATPVLSFPYVGTASRVTP